MQTLIAKRAIAALLLTLVLTVAATACINDRDSDTLTLQAKGLPDTISVITGRFPRNPPLFYQMRIQRVTREIAANPNQLRLYDDIAAACDRLGRDDEAIRWMEKKRLRLGSTSPASPSVHEDWYRYYANVGTFHAHHWIRAGAKQDQSQELSQARDEIARAIQIKPDAHFGREKYQLAVMDWLLHHRSESLASYLLETRAERSAASSGSGTIPDINKAVEGMSGLIVLGGAWESPDIFAALADHLLIVHRDKVGYLAQLRSQELLDAHRKSLVSGFPVYSEAGLRERPIHPDYRDELTAKYRSLRAEAEEWQKRRWTYMEKRLRSGKHPDTDPAFWKYWQETQPPLLYLPQRWSIYRFLQLNGIAVGFFVIATTLALICFGIRRLYLQMRH